jgi:hypothetical protein
LAVISLAISPVVHTLSNARSISKNKVTVAFLLLKPCVMRSKFLNKKKKSLHAGNYYYSLHSPDTDRTGNLFNYCVFSRCRGNSVSTELFPSNGCCTVACLDSCYLAMDLHVTR